MSSPHSHHDHQSHEHASGQEGGKSGHGDYKIISAAGSSHSEHAGHGGHDHAAMVADFRRRFWVTLVLTPPVLLLSPMIRHWLGLTEILSFPGDGLLLFALSSIAYLYGGWPFLVGFFSELRKLQPGMMTLIALAISAAYFFSAAVTFGFPGEAFYWELVTLIAIMLLGHWVEMRSVMGASRALEELVRLLPDSATRIKADGSSEEVSISALQPGDQVLVRPGAKVPVDGEIVEGSSGFNEAMLTGESRPVSKGVGATAIGGAINGAIVIYGRLQPIVATIATGAVYYGIALLLRPFPGGSVNEDLADALTGRVLGVVPASLVVLLVIVLVVWVPFSRSVLGRAAYASGSSETAAYMSGVPIRRGKFAAYTLAGLLSAIGGLFLTFFTYTGEAAYASGNSYTLFSIAAVVLGGVSLFGGKGSAIGAIFGALAFRTIGDLLFVFDFDPLWQPLFQGVILLLAVSLGAFALFRVRNRLEWFL